MKRRASRLRRVDFPVFGTGERQKNFRCFAGSYFFGKWIDFLWKKMYNPHVPVQLD
jgi:hypothetical protein